MTKLFAIALATLALVSTANAQAPTYLDVLRTCSAEWKESDTRKNTPKGEGMAAWQTFRKECVDRKGYVTKRNRTPADFVRVPDKN